MLMYGTRNPIKQIGRQLIRSHKIAWYSNRMMPSPIPAMSK
jgi:hypothetical protein